MSDHFTHDLAHALEHASHLLPAQMPIERFVHHNTLHAFESLPFNEAVLRAHELYGAQPYMDEGFFRQAYRQGRITRADLDDVLERAELSEEELGWCAGLTRREIVRSWMLQMPVEEHGAGLAWFMEEYDVLGHYPEGLSRRAYERLRLRGAAHSVLPALWAASKSLTLPAGKENARVSSPRLDASLYARTGERMDTVLEPELIRLSAAYLDQGVSHWSAPDQREGFLAFVTHQYTSLAGLDPSPWRRYLHKLLTRHKGATAEEVVRACLQMQGMRGELEDQVTHTLLALPGWAGMFSIIERRPDTAPVADPPAATLLDFLAVRLCMECACLEQMAPKGGHDESFRKRLGEAKSRRASGALEVQFSMFYALVCLGVSAVEIEAMSASQRKEFCELLRAHGSLERRALWQLAYERHYRVHLLDGVIAHGAVCPVQGSRTPERPEAQIVMCIDDREESIRRHIEEIDPRCETLGAGGFFGVAMNFRAYHSPRCAPLCPPVVTPKHYVYERLIHQEYAHPTTTRHMYAKAHTAQGTTLFSGGVTALLGLHKLVPMITRVLAPQKHRKIFAQTETFSHTHTKLVVHRTDDALTAEGWLQGYSYEEMSRVVCAQLEDLGMVKRFAPLVAMIGHGSTSVNNPHGAGYGCGACGGGHGGANGRAFAQMANTPEVRALLAEKGIMIPKDTWFIGGYHNTTNNDVAFYDVDEIPHTHATRFAELEEMLLLARQRDAAERCRRFESASLTWDGARALEHVEGRSEDLAQPRPEYGHTANALCVVGRREWTRDLFLDRRAFLVSYDPRVDDEKGTILTRLLGSMGPVGAGINLEYYFSRVDNARYGSGSKLPHNVSGLVGVMNGHSSDLRTGLPWQMVELHEPIRLMVLIEGRPEQIAAIVEAHAGLKRLVHNRWILAAVYDPAENQAWFLHPEGFEAHISSARPRNLVTRSSEIYAGQRDLLHPVTVQTSATPSMESAHVA